MQKKSPNLSVILIAKNEAENIRACLESVKWAKEIIVVIDQRTKDKTAEIARKYTTKIYWRIHQGQAKQKQYALKKASGEWILNIDADERVTVDLKKEILKAINCKQNDAYALGRTVFFLGKIIPPLKNPVQPVIRLFRRKKAHFSCDLVHDRVIINGKVGKLKKRLLHFGSPTLEKLITKYNEFSSLEAQELYQAGARTNFFKIIVSPLNAFIKQYFIWRSNRLGTRGFVHSLTCALYHFLKQLKIWEKQEAVIKEKKIRR